MSTFPGMSRYLRFFKNDVLPKSWLQCTWKFEDVTCSINEIRQTRYDRLRHLGMSTFNITHNSSNLTKMREAEADNTMYRNFLLTMMQNQRLIFLFPFFTREWGGARVGGEGWYSKYTYCMGAI